MTEPRHNRAPGAGGRGRLRASHADRERVVEVLKDAFVQGRLNKGELDARVGRAFASRTYAELAALTADIPDDGPLPDPGGADHIVVLGLAAGLIVAAVIVFGGLLKYGAFGVLAIPIVAVVPLVLIGNVAEQRHSRRQLPPRPRQGAQASEVQQPGQPSRPGQAEHDPALPRRRPDRTRSDLRTHGSRAWRAKRPVPTASPI